MLPTKSFIILIIKIANTINFYKRKVSFTLYNNIFKEFCESNLTAAIAQNEERLSHIWETCVRMRELENVSSEANMWVSPSFSLAFCVVPKVGCTYWKRVLRWVIQINVGCSYGKRALR